LKIRNADGAVHFSNLKQMSLSPLHYKSACEGARNETRAMRVGTLVHKIALGGSYAVYDGDRRGGEWKQFKAEHVGIEIFTTSEYKDAAGAGEALRTNKTAAPYLLGLKEHELAWKDSITGVECAGRLDVLGDGFVSDVKVTADASPTKFMVHCIRMYYHAQLLWYGRGAVHNEHPVAGYYILGVETKAPHAVTVLRLTNELIVAGAISCNEWLDRLRECERTNEWPGYSDQVLDLDAPGWFNTYAESEEESDE